MDKQKMNKNSANQSNGPTGLKLLALLTAGAASGGCMLTESNFADFVKLDVPAASLESESSSEAPAPDAGQQGQQGQF